MKDDEKYLDRLAVGLLIVALTVTLSIVW